jgi:dTDP-4-amino-4,6-dideoxygalactose transaminase
MPIEYFKDISSIQIKAGLRELSGLEGINSLRKKNAHDYTRFLKSNNKTYVDENLFDNHLFLKYPILVKERDLFLQLAEKEKISLGDWFLSPLHPVKNNLELWGLKREMFPTANGISKKIINLPTDIKENSSVMKFLTKHLELVD